MTLRLVTAPTATAVSLAEAKAHLRVTTTDDDAIITAIIAAATDGLDWLGRTILPTTWAYDMPYFLDECWLPRPPFTAVSSITYKDENNETQTVSTSVYEAVKNSNGEGIVRIKYDESWPVTLGYGEPVTITYTAGYSTVPDAIKQAILLRVGRIYETRDAASVSPERIRAEQADGIGRIEYSTIAASSESISDTERFLLTPYKVWQEWQ